MVRNVKGKEREKEGARTQNHRYKPPLSYGNRGKGGRAVREGETVNVRDWCT